jgi:hypothetical protein
MTEGFILSHGEDERLDHILLMNLEQNCFVCKHMHDDLRTCEAYPDGIPTEFLYLDEVHNRPHPGDHGIQFEPVEEATPVESPE